MVLHEERTERGGFGELAGVVEQEREDRTDLVDRRLVGRRVLLAESQRILHRLQSLAPRLDGTIGRLVARRGIAGRLGRLQGSLRLLKRPERGLAIGQFRWEIVVGWPEILPETGCQLPGLLCEVAVGGGDLASELVRIGFEHLGRGGLLWGERLRTGGKQLGGAVLHRGHLGRHPSLLDGRHGESEKGIRAVLLGLERRRSGDLAIGLVFFPALEGDPEGLGLEAQAER